VMANFWMHNGFLQVEGEKMSKSLGNFFTIRELLADWPGEVLRFNMLRTHYRQPIDWTLKGVVESFNTLESLTSSDPTFVSGNDATMAQPVLDALSDDLNTPKAIAELHALHGKGDVLAVGSTLRALGFSKRPQSLRQVDEKKVVALIDARNAARKARNFKEADRVRDELNAMGIELEDKKDGTTAWKVKR
jgi:cysteinyl-tRNA synthetase